nr:PREDICTED: BAG domain-containing protein Samui isoform X2 [Bemisia tabaci]
MMDSEPIALPYIPSPGSPIPLPGPLGYPAAPPTPRPNEYTLDDLEQSEALLDNLIAGHPFDDDFKSRIDNLAQRHPESADLLRNIIGNSWSKAGSGSPSNSQSDVKKDDVDGSANGASNYQAEPQNSRPDPSNKENIHEIKPNLSEDSMRDTVLRPSQEEDESARNQRSWSAPPEGKSAEPQRFVSKIEINPVNPDESNMNSNTTEQQQAAPPPPPPQPQPGKQPNVRHIPIFVEGRSEPVVSKELPTEEVFTQTRGPTPTFNARPNYQQFPSPKKKSEKQHFVHQEPPVQSPHKPQPQQPNHHQQNHQQPQQNSEHHKAEQAPPPPPPPAAPPKPKTAMEKVEEVQKEVDDLRKQVDEFQGKSRQEKAYLYLDEMLTRELIKLDNIETEGKEDVRMARKNAIKSIQNAISVLESKVPLPPTSPVVDNSETSVVLYGQDASSETAPNAEKMEVESTNNSPHEISADESTEVKKKKNT